MPLWGRAAGLETGVLGQRTVLLQSVGQNLIHKKPVAGLCVVSGIIEKIEQRKVAMPDAGRNAGFPPRRLDPRVKPTVGPESDGVQDPGTDRQKSARWIEGVDDFGWGGTAGSWRSKLFSLIKAARWAGSNSGAEAAARLGTIKSRLSI
jgi:hypothetical protein